MNIIMGHQGSVVLILCNNLLCMVLSDNIVVLLKNNCDALFACRL